MTPDSGQLTDLLLEWTDSKQDIIAAPTNFVDDCSKQITENEPSTTLLLNGSIRVLLSQIDYPKTGYFNEDPFEHHMNHSDHQMQGIYGTNFENMLKPILAGVYKKVEVFLQRNSLSISFLVIFKDYVNYLIKCLIDPFQDEYVLQIENELSLGYELTPKMEMILTRFLTSPTNIVMRFVYLEFNMKRRLKKRYFHRWVQERTFNEYCLDFKGSQQHLLVSKTFNDWYNRTVKYNAKMQQRADIFSEARRIESCFNQWLLKYENNCTSNNIAQLYFTNNIFERIQKKSRFLDENAAKAKKYYKSHQQTRYFKVWRLALALKASKSQAKLRKEGNYYHKLRNKLSEIIALDIESAKRYDNVLTRKTFNLWLSKFKSLESRKLQTTKYRKTYLIKKYFDKFVNGYIRIDKLKSRLFKFDQLVVQRFFSEHWIKIHQLTNLSIFYGIKVDNHIVRIYYNLWRHRFLYQVKADQKLEYVLLNRYFKVWRTESIIKTRKLKLDSQLQIKWLGKWKLMKEHRKRVFRFSNELLLKPSWDKWRTKVRDYKSFDAKAAHFSLDHLLVKIMQKWKERSNEVKHLKRISREYVLKKFLEKYKRKLNSLKKLKRIYDQNNPLTSSKHLLCGKFFNTWLSNAELRKEIKCELLYEGIRLDLQRKCFDKYIRIWISRLRFFNDYCSDRAKLLEELHLKSSAFNCLKRRYQSVLLHSEQGALLNEKSTRRTFFYKWFNELANVNSIQRLGDMEFEKIIRSICMDTFNRWRIKLLKVQRNQESVLAFRSRWDRATIRALFLLWQEKLQRSVHSQSQDHNVKDFRFDGDKISILQETPAKNILSSQDIPVPRSETIKRDRMEQIMSHYTNTRTRRAIPSPLKSPDGLRAEMFRRQNESASPNRSGRTTKIGSGISNPQGTVLDFGKIPNMNPYSKVSSEVLRQESMYKMKADQTIKPRETSDILSRHLRKIGSESPTI